jgi:peptide/nickel transport system substrate-binding protein
VRNEGYWGRKPRITRRIYKLITNDDAAFQVLQKGEMDVMNLRAEQWVGQASRPAFEARFNKFRYPGNGFSYIGWNLRRPLFADKRVRRALTMLLDRELIREEIYQGLARVVSGSFHPDEPEYNKEIEPLPYDPDAAEALLAEAGWVDSNNNGTLDKDGAEFTFELLLTNDNPVAEQIATVFQESLRFAGVGMTIRQLEWATFLQSVKSHDFDASMLGWSLVPYPDPYQVWHSTQAIKDGSNSVGFVNEEADRLMEEARTVFDRDQRVALYHRFHEILHEEQPYTFLFCREDLVTVDKRIHNTVVYPRGLDSLEWWVPLPLQKYK